MFRGALPISTRNYNKRLSLDLIRFTPGGISRAELARRLGLTRSAVTAIISDLMQNGLVREAEEGPATAGRPPVLLEMNPERGYLAGVDIGATHISFVITNFACQTIFELEKPFDISTPPEIAMGQIHQCLLDLLSGQGLSLSNLLGIGVGVPGPVIIEKGTVSAPPLMPGWDEYPIRDRLQELWQRPVSLNNDAELGALGEWTHGAGRGERNLAYIKVGTGIGAGLLLDGEIYHGETGSAGEIGHITILQNGPRCNCGNYGCLEALAGGAAIARRAQEAVRSGRRTLMAMYEPIEKISAADVAEAAQRGDLVAQEIMKEAGTYLGIAIASLINLFNPGVVVVGGGISQTGDLLLQPIRQVVQQRSLRSTAQAARITSAVLGRRSTSIGAVVQALNVFLDQWTTQG